jgi:hypothetical protein
VVEENLAVNTRWPSHNHMSTDCTIRRNTFIALGGTVRVAWLKEDGYSVDVIEELAIDSRNRFCGPRQAGKCQPSRSIDPMQ